MVAYSFKSSFAADIVAGRKCQTVRHHRKRHARVGEPVQLYTGMRTKACRKLITPDPVCTGIEDIQIALSATAQERVSKIELDGLVRLSRTEMEDFARRDGFENLNHFGRWWMMTHANGADEYVFDGVVIHWKAEASCASAGGTS